MECVALSSLSSTSSCRLLVAEGRSCPSVGGRQVLPCCTAALHASQASQASCTATAAGVLNLLYCPSALCLQTWSTPATSRCRPRPERPPSSSSRASTTVGWALGQRAPALQMCLLSVCTGSARLDIKQPMSSPKPCTVSAAALLSDLHYQPLHPTQPSPLFLNDPCSV